MYNYVHVLIRVIVISFYFLAFSEPSLSNVGYITINDINFFLKNQESVLLWWIRDKSNNF